MLVSQEEKSLFRSLILFCIYNVICSWFVLLLPPKKKQILCYAAIFKLHIVPVTAPHSTIGMEYPKLAINGHFSTSDNNIQ